MSDQIQPVRRTIRRYAHELYPHGNEGETRDLAVEVPYLYARAVGLDVWGTSWNDRSDVSIERYLARTRELVAARRVAFLADALPTSAHGTRLANGPTTAPATTACPLPASSRTRAVPSRTTTTTWHRPGT